MDTIVIHIDCNNICWWIWPLGGIGTCLFIKITCPCNMPPIMFKHNPSLIAVVGPGVPVCKCRFMVYGP